MKISVALCTFNGERFLGEQLESLSAQSRHPDELVVSDDGSRDGTVALLAEFARNAPFPMTIFSSEERRGSTFNFEFAVSKCSGDVVALCDQDDVWEPQKLDVIESAFRPSSVTLFFSDASLVEEDLQATKGTAWEAVGLTPKELQEIREGRAFELLTRRNVVTGATMAITRSVANAAIPFPELLHRPRLPHQHDGWLATIASAMGQVVACPDRLIRYRQHGEQQIGLRVETLPRRHLRIVRERLQDRRRLIEDHRDWLLAVAERAHACALLAAGDRRTAFLEDATEHFRSRASAVTGAASPRQLVREAAVGRYSRHSGGPGACALDLATLLFSRERDETQEGRVPSP